MPELPEVEAVRRGLESTITGRRIENIQVLWPRIIQEPDDIELFKQQLIGQQIESIDRRGKFLIFNLTDYGLISHLRMEGKYYLYSAEDEMDKHTHVIFTFDDGSELRYLDVRKFGRISLVDKEEVFNHKSLLKLGPEPTRDQFAEEEVRKHLNNKTKAIKTILLDQSLVAGVGNIYADEILFQVKIYPGTPGGQLTNSQIHELYEATLDIMERATIAGGSTIRSYTNTFGLDGSFQDQHKVYGKTGQPCVNCGHEIEKIKLNGRGTHYCPHCQKEK